MLEPSQPVKAHQDDSAAAQLAPPSGAPRLLAIDDDNLHRMIICRVAAKAGYAPAGAATYDEAAKLAQQVAFDCITLDLSLGPHIGAELLRHFCALGCKAPIIVITGTDSVTCNETVKLGKSLNLNITQSMSKPVDLTVLRYRLERLKAQRETAVVAS